MKLVRLIIRSLFIAGIVAGSALGAEPRHRARDLGVPFQGEPGPLNAITDVAGVEVGQTTLIRGEGPLVRGRGPVRTGVTIIHPLGKLGRNGVAAGRAVINGTGEFTGMAMVDEIGQLFGPIALTGTGNISVVRDAMIDWAARPGFLPPDELILRLLPAVGETLDSRLNDVFGHPMKPSDVIAALEAAKGGPVQEGNVGGGTGMIAFLFKGGIGTASRVLRVGPKTYMVGVLVQDNFGNRQDLRIAGVPVGEEIPDLTPEIPPEPAKSSLLVVIATDAPLQAHQLTRLANRAAFGIGRLGSTGNNYSGEFALAFSTTNTFSYKAGATTTEVISDDDHATMNALFAATAQATEEAVVNQLVASETMTGANGVTVHGLPRDRLVALLKKYNRYRNADAPSAAALR